MKTTWGRIPLEGVWPLSPSFDTIGPMARDVAGLETGMALLEPGFLAGARGSWRVGRLRMEADPLIDAAIDRALAATGWEIVEIDMPEWDSVSHDGRSVARGRGLDHQPGCWPRATPTASVADVLDRLHLGRDASDQVSMAAARTAQALWCARHGLGVQAGRPAGHAHLDDLPPGVGTATTGHVARCTLPVNLAGIPALALPVADRRTLPASLQLVAPENSEETLVAAGLIVEAASPLGRGKELRSRSRGLADPASPDPGSATAGPDARSRTLRMVGIKTDVV